MFSPTSLKHMSGKARSGVLQALIFAAFIPMGMGQDAASPADERLSARDQAQVYLENDEARKAVATLVEAARANPADRVIGAMIYGCIRDNVWHLPQTLPIPHASPVRVLAFSPDSKQLATGAASGLIVVSPAEALDEEDAKARRIELQEGSAILGASFSSDGKRLAVASADAGLKIWDVAARRAAFETPKPASPATVFAESRVAQLVAIGMEDGTLQVLDVAAGRLLAPPAGSKARIVDLAFSRDGKRLAAAAADQTVRVWDLPTGNPVGEPMKRPSAITSIDFGREGRHLLIAGADKTATLTDIESGVAVMPASVCGAGIKKARVSPDDSAIATMLDDGTVQFWDALTGKELMMDVREDGEFNDMAWSPSGLRLATASAGDDAAVWSARDGTRWGESLPHDAPVLAVAYSPDGKLLATGCASGKARLWRMDGGNTMPTVRLHAMRARAAAYSLDGEHLVTTSEDHTALHWISGQVRPVGPALKHKGKVTCGVFDKDVTRILTSDDTGVAQLWNAETGRADGPPFLHKSAVNWVDFHPDGKRFVTASGASAFVWSVDRRDKPLAIITHPGKGKSEMKHARFSPDGKWLATASTDGTARVWDAATYKPATEPIKRGFPVLCVRFSPDSSRLVVGGEDAQAAVFDTATWKPVGKPIVFPGPVFSAAITADNLFLVAASFLLNAVQFFEIETGLPLGNGLNVPSQATCVDYHLPDKAVVVACDDGTVRAYGSPFVDQDVPAWTCDFAERMVGYRKTGPDDFQQVDSHFGQLANYVTGAARATNADFPRLVRWKMTMGVERTGMPRFVSTLAANIDRRVEERSVDALYECFEAAPVDNLVYAALSAYITNGRQSEFLADMVLANKDAEPLARAFAATALVNAGRSEEARKVMAEAAAAAPNDARVMRREAKLNARMMNKKLAIEQFERALVLEPNNFETYRTFGWALYNLNEPQKAAEQFRLAQDLTGDLDSDLVAGLCLCAAAVKNMPEATAAFRRLVALDPAWKEAGHLASQPGWTQREVRALEAVRSALFPARR